MFANTEDMRNYLTSQKIDVTAFGSGSAKSIDDLWQEVCDGETVLDSSSGQVMRNVNVLNVYIVNSKQQVLQEEFQILPKGVKRARRVPLSEKLKAGEAWIDAVHRAVKEELGSVLPSCPNVIIDEASHEVVVEVGTSHSYPGLPCKYTVHKVKATVSSLPETERFVTTEDRPDGIMENHWLWLPADCAS